MWNGQRQSIFPRDGGETFFLKCKLDVWCRCRKREDDRHIFLLTPESRKTLNTYKAAAAHMEQYPSKYTEEDVARLFLYPDGNNHIRREEQGKKAKTEEHSFSLVEKKIIKETGKVTKVNCGKASQQQANAFPDPPEGVEQQPQGDRLLQQVARHQDELRADSDFIRHHSQDEEPFHQDALGNHLGHHPQADSGYKIEDAQGFQLQSIPEASGPKVNLTLEDQMNQQAVTGFQLLDDLEDDDEGKEEDVAHHVTEEERVEEEAAVEMREISEESEEVAGQSFNRTFEDIFNETGSFMDKRFASKGRTVEVADEEDISMEEYERLDDHEENESAEDNDEISVVNHFKSIKFAKPIPKWP